MKPISKTGTLLEIRQLLTEAACTNLQHLGLYVAIFSAVMTCLLWMSRTSAEHGKGIIARAEAEEPRLEKEIETAQTELVSLFGLNAPEAQTHVSISRHASLYLLQLPQEEIDRNKPAIQKAFGHILEAQPETGEAQNKSIARIKERLEAANAEKSLEQKLLQELSATKERIVESKKALLECMIATNESIKESKRIGEELEAKPMEIGFLYLAGSGFLWGYLEIAAAINKRQKRFCTALAMNLLSDNEDDIETTLTSEKQTWEKGRGMDWFAARLMKKLDPTTKALLSIIQNEYKHSREQ